MSWDRAWEKVFNKQEWGKYPSESLIRFIARNFYHKDRENIKILEVGCGIGANVWYLAREGFDAYGIDGSQTAIERGRKRMQKEGLKADLKVADVEVINFADNYFDAVIDCECLSFNSKKSTQNILSEIKRVLKKDGLFYSRATADAMYLGRHTKLSNLEFDNIRDGPLKGKGFVRLTSRNGIKELYGKLFKVLSVDKIEYTEFSESFKVAEWVIILQKE